MLDRQHIQASGLKASKELAIRVSARLDELLGFIEWLKTDQVKKDSRRNTQKLDDLSIHIEKISRKMESVSREKWLQSEDEKMNGSALNEILEHERGIVDLLSNIEKAVKEITGEMSVPGSDDITNIQKMLVLMEHKIKERESLLENLREMI